MPVKGQRNYYLLMMADDAAYLLDTPKFVTFSFLGVSSIEGRKKNNRLPNATLVQVVVVVVSAPNHRLPSARKKRKRARKEDEAAAGAKKK